MRRAIVLIGMLILLSPVTANGRRARSAGGADDRKSAAPSDEATERRAQQLLAASQAALSRQELKLAAEKATESLRAVPSADALFVLGRVAQLEGRVLEAQDLLRRYLADPDLELDEKSPTQSEARRFTQTLSPGSAQLKIVGDAGTLIMLDGRLVGVLPLPLPLLIATGTHKVELVRGRVRLEDEVRVPLGRLVELRSDAGRGALISSVLPGMILLDSYRGIDDASQLACNRALEIAVENEHLSPLPQLLAIEAAGEPQPGPCPDEGRCLMDLTERSQADYLLRLRMEKQANDFRIEMQIFDAEIGDVAATETQRCTNCTTEQAAKMLASLFPPTWKRATGRPHGKLVLTSEPAGATVILDGRKLGVTPIDRALFAGRGSLTLKKEGYLDLTQEVSIPDNESEQLTLRLAPVPPPVEKPKVELAPIAQAKPRRPAWRYAVGGLALAGGLLSTGIGTAALVVDGHCAEPNDLSASTDPASCSQLYVGTSTLGYGLVPVGAVLILTGTLLIALPPKARPSKR